MPEPVNVFDYLDREPGQPRMSDLWEWARDDYFAGESADVVCERHKLSRSQFFERAKREGWLRRDQPRKSAEPAYDAEAEAAFVEEALDRPPPSAYALQRRAWAMVERAILMGRRVEAAGWTRLARDLRKLACEEAGGVMWKSVVTAEAAKPDSADSLRPPPFTGEVAAKQTEGANRAPPPSHAACSPLAPSVTSAAPPRHLPRCAGEAETGPDSPDAPVAPPPPIPVSPAQAGAQVGDAEANGEPHPERPSIWAPACTGETEVRGRPDSADFHVPQAWARLAFKPSRRSRRRRGQPAADLAVS